MAEKLKRLTLAELREKTATAIREATTFEKTPTFDIQVGQEILFMVKKTIEGNFDAPIVIAGELRILDGNGKFITKTLKAYTQEGKDGPKEFTEIKPGDEIRVPSFVVRRAVEKGLEFHPKQVYWSKYIEDKKLEGGRTYKVAAVDLVGTEFPET